MPATNKECFLVMTLLVRNEEDIIEQNIQYHLDQGVDHIIDTDNLSTDGTHKILEKYEKKGLLTLIDEFNDTYQQSKWVIRMARMAYEKFNAKWIINCDADEFWFANNNDLKSFFRTLSSENIVIGERQDMICILDDNLDRKPFYERMIYKKTISTNAKGFELSPKRAHRACGDIKISQGNHTILNLFINSSKQYEAQEKLEILHFPIRSPKQFKSKILLGGAAYERNKEIGYSTGSEWREMYKELKETGNIKFLNDNLFNKSELSDLIEKKKIILDDRLFKIINGLKK